MDKYFLKRVENTLKSLPKNQWQNFVEDTLIWRDFMGLTRALGFPELGDTRTGSMNISKLAKFLSDNAKKTNASSNFESILAGELAFLKDQTAKIEKTGVALHSGFAKYVNPQRRTKTHPYELELHDVFKFSGKPVNEYKISDLPKLIQWTIDMIDQELLKKDHPAKNALSTIRSKLNEDLTKLNTIFKENKLTKIGKKALAFVQSILIGICAAAFLAGDAAIRLAIAATSLLFWGVFAFFFVLPKKITNAVGDSYTFFAPKETRHVEHPSPIETNIEKDDRHHEDNEGSPETKEESPASPRAASPHVETPTLIETTHLSNESTHEPINKPVQEGDYEMSTSSEKFVPSSSVEIENENLKPEQLWGLANKGSLENRWNQMKILTLSGHAYLENRQETLKKVILYLAISNTNIKKALDENDLDKVKKTLDSIDTLKASLDQNKDVDAWLDEAIEALPPRSPSPRI